VIIGISYDSRARRIERKLEIIRQVPIRRLAANDESILGNVRSMDNVVACLGLVEDGRAHYIGHK